MKTLAELELESSQGFKNPVVTDAEFEATRKASREKAEREALTTPIDNSTDDEEEEE